MIQTLVNQSHDITNKDVENLVMLAKIEEPMETKNNQ